MILNKFCSTGKVALFDLEDTTDKLKKIGNPLEKFSQVIDFLKKKFRTNEMFRPVLEAKLLNHDKKNVGAKPIDVLLMFKIMILQLHSFNRH